MQQARMNCVHWTHLVALRRASHQHTCYLAGAAMPLLPCWYCSQLASASNIVCGLSSWGCILRRAAPDPSAWLLHATRGVDDMFRRGSRHHSERAILGSARSTFGCARLELYMTRAGRCAMVQPAVAPPGLTADSARSCPQTRGSQPRSLHSCRVCAGTSPTMA
jgi:hypothetical protein